jgi:hypothetical protein
MISDPELKQQYDMNIYLWNRAVNVCAPINYHFLADLDHIQIHQDHHVHRVHRTHMLQTVVNQRVMHVHLVSIVLNEIRHHEHVRLDLFEMLQ